MPQIIERSPFGQAPIAPAPPAAAPPAAAAAGQQTAGSGSPAKPGEANPPAAKTPDAQRLEALAQRESRIRREAQRVSQERTQLEGLKTQLLQQQQENQRLRGWAQRFYREPIQVLNEAGVHGDVITQGLLNQPSREAVSIRQMQATLQQLQEQNQNLEKKITDGQASTYEQAKNQVRSDAKILLNADKSYEACGASGDDAVEAIVELIEQTMEKENRLMSVKEAADEIENHLIDEAVKFAALAKVKTKLGAPVTPPASGGQTGAAGGTPAGQTTLSNRSIPAPVSRPGATPKEREKERVQRAIAAFESAAQARAQ